MRACLVAGLVALLAGCATPPAPVPSSPPADHAHGAAFPEGDGTATLRGPTGQTLTLTRDLLLSLPQIQITQTYHGKTATYSGVELSVLAGRAGAPLGEQLRGKALSTIVLVKARDGYGLALSLGEIDPSISGRRIALAHSANGQPLDAEEAPFRLVIDGDKVAARSARMVSAIEIRSVD